MRKVMRDVDTHTYWEKRWSAFESDQSEFKNMDIYPVKYVDRIMSKGSRTLEAGCGLGRVVKHYHKRGFDICGCDYSSVAVEKLNASNPELNIIQADITCLPYKDGEFNNLLALGVFHGIEDLAAIDKGIAECIRCLTPEGYLIASVRADTIENSLIDSVTHSRGNKGTCFHKWCFTQKDFESILKEQGLKIISAELVTNVCFLTKFRIFRKDAQVDEQKARSSGFELNFFGNVIYSILKTVAPNSFGTTWVFTAKK